MKVFVLGHRGMLGHVVARYLAEQGHYVLTSDNRYQGRPRDPLIEVVRDSGCAWIINAIGLIKQKSDSRCEMLRVNALLPLHLKSRMRSYQHLIQPSTDCVFSGQRGGYLVDQQPDAIDAYGLSKILGEAVADDRRCTVIRTSIIGPELRTGHGLMGWFLNQRGEVNGFVNHQWNGITSLEWAKICDEIICANSCGGTIVQPGIQASLSKYELLSHIARAWQKEISIKPVRAPDEIDRTLIPTLPRQALPVQLAELHEWYCD